MPLWHVCFEPQVVYQNVRDVYILAHTLEQNKQTNSLHTSRQYGTSAVLSSRLTQQKQKNILLTECNSGTNPKTAHLLVWYGVIYLLTEIGLSPGGSSTVHIYTKTIHRTIRNKTIHRITQQFWKSAGRAPSWLVIPWHLSYNRGKSTEKPQSG